MSDPGRRLRPGRGSRPSPASLGIVRVDADFEDEYPGGDATCTEAYASLVRAGEALLGELDRHLVAELRRACDSLRWSPPTTPASPNWPPAALASDHLEYRLGVFQGNRGKDEVNAFRYAGRLSLWVVGAQTGLFYRGTSLGQIQSMEIGGSFDRQKQYSAYTGDFFWDQPVGNGDGVTLQFDYTKWDGGTFLTAIPKQNTILAEAGYYLGAIKTQPFFQYSRENFDHHSSPDQKRTTFGLGFFPHGHNSDVKFAYTRLQGTGQVSRNQYQLQYQIFIW